MTWVCLPAAVVNVKNLFDINKLSLLILQIFLSMGGRAALPINQCG